MDSMKAHAVAHGYDVSPIYEHTLFMLRHPDWTVDSHTNDTDLSSEYMAAMFQGPTGRTRYMDTGGHSGGE